MKNIHVLIFFLLAGTYSLYGDNNASVEGVTIDNILATNAAVPPPCDLTINGITTIDESCPGAYYGFLSVKDTTSNGPDAGYQ